MSKAKDPYAALGDRTRRTILEVLRDRETMTAGEIASLFPDVSRASVSKHLKVLRDVRLVRAREHGREWHYRLEGSALRRSRPGCKASHPTGKRAWLG